MLYEFAIIPDVFDQSLIVADTALGVILVELLRGISDNGLIADLNKKGWAKYVQAEVTNLSPALRDKIITCLNILDDRHRLVRHPRSATGDPATGDEWLSVALDSHNRIEFHGIILSDALLARCRGASCYLGLSTVLDSAPWLARRRSLTIHKTLSEYRQILVPVLRHAKTLSMVDPYLNAHEQRYRDMVDLCSALMGNRAHDRLPGRIQIHTHINHQEPEGHDTNYYLAQWRGALTPLATRDGHRFKVFIWRGRPGDKAFHDRFILTDQCGISIPAGLDVRTASTHTTTWSLLDEEDRRSNLDDYEPTVSPFQIVPPSPVDVP